ncbi:MAG: threonine synthase [bacterium]
MVEFYYQCNDCNKRYQRDEVRYLCPACGQKTKPGYPLQGVLSVRFDYDSIRQRFKSDRTDWSCFYAIEDRYFPPYPVGNTPFAKVESLGKDLGCTNVWVKNDGLNPSGSLKDRASQLLVAEANRLDEKSIVTASTGNAACSLAAAAAAAGKRAIILVPHTAPQEKLVQMLIHGAQVIPIKGTYDDAFRLSLEFTQSYGGLNRNTAYHPLTIEGKKTVGLEIWAQNNFTVPDVIVVPVGDGVIISGVFKAFEDLKKAGLTDRLPRLVCVQAESSAAVHHFITTGEFRRAAPASIADSISVSVPSNIFMASRAVHESGGFSLTVNENDILAGQSLLARRTGIFAEPSAAATVAALAKIRDTKSVDADDQIVLLVTGHGLKDVRSAKLNLLIPDAVEPNMEAINAMLTAQK